MNVFSSFSCLPGLGSSFLRRGRRTFGTKAIGVALDIDGVLIRGQKPLPGAKESLEKLRHHNIPFLFMTNGGGVMEEKKLADLENKLGTDLRLNVENQMILAHTPMRELAQKYKDKQVMILGCKEELEVAKNYGFQKIVSPQQYAAEYEHLSLYPVKSRLTGKGPSEEGYEQVSAIIIMHDPIDWHLEIQVCCDILEGVHPLGEKNSTSTIPVYNSNEDLTYAGAYHHPRFAQGAFLSALKHLYNLKTGKELNVTRYGKPNKITYEFAESLLAKQVNPNSSVEFDAIYMIGDNPAADIRGATLSGLPWQGVLLKTGIYDGTGDIEGAHHLCEDVSEAIDMILNKHVLG
mmetsp:Transcript_6432/g.7361  ORF Transcript_6432/g.7361 Transcript_6432/m.7361 type:complete len:348 (-) Transcript_6432:403-1446(-)